MIYKPYIKIQIPRGGLENIHPIHPRLLLVEYRQLIDKTHVIGHSAVVQGGERSEPHHQPIMQWNIVNGLNKRDS